MLGANICWHQNRYFFKRLKRLDTTWDFARLVPYKCMDNLLFCHQQKNNIDLEIELVNPFKDSSHSLNWTGLWESLESVLPNHQGKGCAFHANSRKSNPETSLARLLLFQNVAGCLRYPALTRAGSSRSAAVFPGQACKLQVFLASPLASYEPTVFPASRLTSYDDKCLRHRLAGYVYGSAWRYLSFQIWL